MPTNMPCPVFCLSNQNIIIFINYCRNYNFLILSFSVTSDLSSDITIGLVVLVFLVRRWLIVWLIMKCISCDNSLDYLVSPSWALSLYLFVAGDDNLSVSDSPLSPLTPLSPSLLRSTPSPKVRPSLPRAVPGKICWWMYCIAFHLLPVLSGDCVSTVSQC